MGEQVEIRRAGAGSVESTASKTRFYRLQCAKRLAWGQACPQQCDAVDKLRSGTRGQGGICVEPASRQKNNATALEAPQRSPKGGLRRPDAGGQVCAERNETGVSRQNGLVLRFSWEHRSASIVSLHEWREFRHTDSRQKREPSKNVQDMSRAALTSSLPFESGNPQANCALCERLKSFRHEICHVQPDWFNAPVPSFGDAQGRLLIVGLAPGLNGANRTGRPFTGDGAGELLYPALEKFGFSTGTYSRRADDGLALTDCAITNAVRCVPPQNRPIAQEIRNCADAPVPSFGDAQGRLLIVGLAPGLNGANRTGRPFTGDGAGELLYPALEKFGFSTGTYSRRADDGLALTDCAITNAVRCVPPQNRPIAQEIRNCAEFLSNEIRSMRRLRVLLALGRTAHESLVRTLGARQRDFPFHHGARYLLSRFVLFDSYHCSRYNTNTGRLTEAAFEGVLAAVRRELDGVPGSRRQVLED